MCTAVAAASEPVRIFAAASLQGPLDTVARDWAHPTSISYAGSGMIARQISLGAPTDLVILANPDWMAWLQDKGSITRQPRDLVSNRLVLIGPRGAMPLPDPDATSLLGRLADTRLAMGLHASVPAGIYARAWLDHIGAWQALLPHLAETDSVRAALALVARGEVQLGIVYASDAAAEPDVEILWTVPQNQHPPIRYPAASITAEGAAFLDFLMTRTDVFLAAGFAALP